VRLKKAVAKLVTHERVCRVATADERALHAVPVCHVLEEGRVYFGSDPTGRKVRNLQKDPRIAVLVDLYSEDWDLLKGAMIQGTAKLIRRGPQFRRIRTLLYKKYPQYAGDAALEESDSVIVEVTPVHVSAWGMD
jgi:nitroimidazol reductase NimA-like FMN-containing flavoprotein (pyridoxamine 5'-phosphate oxidase superfamily)